MIDVTAAIICRDGKCLIARRAPGDRHAGKWEFPGGKVNPAETPQNGLVREIREEFAIDVVVHELVAKSIHVYDHGKIRLLAYRVTWTSGELILMVHDQIAWVPPDRLLEYDLLPADIPIAKKCQALKCRFDLVS